MKHIEVNQPYDDVELNPELERKINQLMRFFDEHGIQYDKFKPEHLPIIDRKKAYPNFDQYIPAPGQYNLQKWLKTVQDLYRLEKDGINRVQAIRQVTAGWKITETFDFLNWLRFYQEGAHLKYKTAQPQHKIAQLWYENGAPGYFLPIKPDPVKQPEPQVSGQDIDFAREEAAARNEKKEMIERQRSKIIGRLDSAEKLLRSHEGQVFAGDELEILMEAIYQLKKKIQLVNKMSTATRLYEDMIVREANVLARDGFIKAADMLHSLAQANNPPPEGMGQPGKISSLPSVTSPDDPSGAGHPGPPAGGLPSLGPGMPQSAPSSAVPESVPNEMSPTNPQGIAPETLPTQTEGTSVAPPMPVVNDATPPGIVEFLKNMETSNLTVEDQDNLDVMDVEDQLMVAEAQAATTAPTAAPAKTPAKPATEEPLEVTEDDNTKVNKTESAIKSSVQEFDRKVDEAFANVTVQDVINKLTDIAQIYKNRQLSRQLAIVDMMLSSLGMSSLFSNLSEAMNRSLDSNNYISTRIDDILSKLQGALPSSGIDLTSNTEMKPEVAGIKAKLEDDAAKEQARKKMRKEQENAELAGKTTPTVDIGEDLGTKPAAPAPIKSPAPTI